MTDPRQLDLERYISAFVPAYADARLTVLNYSGGRQSAALLWMVLRGELRPRGDFLVLNADPGMENSETYAYNERMFALCREARIACATAPGPNLLADLLELRERKRRRLDNPAFWTRDDAGKRGQLMQKCTREYKIRPMDRFIRGELERRCGLSRKTKRLPPGVVDKWIGFAFDEQHRIKPPDAKYQHFSYPLVEMGMDREAVDRYYRERELPMPPRSVCNACWANGTEAFRVMHDERPSDWAQACDVDAAIRDMTAIGIRETAFVSRTLLSLPELAARGFNVAEGPRAEDYSCDSGYCFV